jgi:ribosomal protein S4
MNFILHGTQQLNAANLDRNSAKNTRKKNEKIFKYLAEWLQEIPNLLVVLGVAMFNFRLTEVQLADLAIFTRNILDILQSRLDIQLTIALNLSQPIQRQSRTQRNFSHRKHVRSSR